jgi:tetratricopeptide (TPR) repeat protein
MDRADFIKQLNIWHENDEHQQIIDAIEKLPRDDWDFEISGLYARALNNLKRFKEALDQLNMFQNEGRENGVWNFRVGYSLYYLNREAEAAEYFQKAIDFGDNGEDTRLLLKHSLFEAHVKLLITDEIALLENGKQDIETQERFDEMMIAINDLRDKYFGNDPAMKTGVENMIRHRVQYLADRFHLNIDHETLLRKLYD